MPIISATGTVRPSIAPSSSATRRPSPSPGRRGRRGRGRTRRRRRRAPTPGSDGAPSSRPARRGRRQDDDVGDDPVREVGRRDGDERRAEERGDEGGARPADERKQAAIRSAVRSSTPGRRRRSAAAAAPAAQREPGGDGDVLGPGELVPAAQTGRAGRDADRALRHARGDVQAADRETGDEGGGGECSSSAIGTDGRLEARAPVPPYPE